jgi:hypothetical protein
MNERNSENRKVTASHAVEKLKKHGTKISLDEGQIILDFMYKLSKLTVKIYNKSKS